jgi:putative transposase
MGKRKFDAGLSMHNRRSIRLKTHDYTSTKAYYITTNANTTEPIFDIPELRKILQDEWEKLPKRFPSITLDEFIIMPDHIHCIIWLNGLAKNAPTLGQVIGAYKSITTVAWIQHIKDHRLELCGLIWHRNYYEKIVWGHTELENYRQYIRANPIRVLPTAHNPQ